MTFQNASLIWEVVKELHTNTMAYHSIHIWSVVLVILIIKLINNSWKQIRKQKEITTVAEVLNRQEICVDLHKL